MTGPASPAPRRRRGDQYLTTTEAATALQLSASGFRSLVSRARNDAVDLHAPRAAWPDARTPLWSRALVQQYAAARPGRGRRRSTGDGVPAGA